MSTLEEQLKREIQEHGEGSPVAQILRDQIRAKNQGKSFQSLYLENELEAGKPDCNPPTPAKKGKGRVIWQGWQTTAEDAPQPVSILYGRNLRK